MLHNNFCYLHNVTRAAFTSEAITHAITPPPLDPRIVVTPAGCDDGLTRVPNEWGKKNLERCCHVDDIMRVVMNFIW